MEKPFTVVVGLSMFFSFFFVVIQRQEVQASDWGYGLETSFGITPESRPPDNYSISFQGMHDIGSGLSLDFIKAADDAYRGGLLVNSGLLVSAFLGLPISNFFIPYVGGGLGIKFNGDEDSGFAGKVDAGVAAWPSDIFYLKTGISYDNIRKGLCISVGAGFKFGESGNSSYMPPAPTPAPTPARPPNPHWTPTITPEELKKVELAYAATVRDIERRGRRLDINNRSERAAFIQQYQGRPDTASTTTARDEKLEYYNSRVTSEQDIVRQARSEPNPFRKVRMIHDWVADTFAYDNDLLWWMRNVSGRNEVFTLGELVNRKRGVCFEYAILFWFLMDAAGVETYLISEVINPTSAHAYNMVIINGTGYIIDTTWDSGNQYENNRIIQFYMTNFKGYFMPGISESYRLRTSQSPKWR